ncbi:LytTR family DNA-binding domain-containing protein [Nitratireductor soli]|uniref:LytTR family DNA-binding domain-containing protein n=1 Tax=Nitratireductor soli TaxID=1670619 RepID=UPI00065E98F5|nr:LytTR family DNA-binding domain-containing protein [Nitratireductor soli]
MPPLSDREIDRRVLLRVTLIAAGFVLAVGVVNASTLVADAARAGQPIDVRVPWILEFTSIVIVVLLVPLVALWERRFPISSGGWLALLPAHLAGSLVFCGLHVAGIVVLRKALFWLLFGRHYVFFEAPVSDLLYEYRKDLLSYALILLVLNLMRTVEEQRREAAVARAEARASGRLTLRSGGRTILLRADAVEWARAAANYVEIRAEGRTHLARISLSALQEQMADAGAEAMRVHRSFLVNTARVREVAPARDGDFRIVMADGSELRGSRRYRHNLPR